MTRAGCDYEVELELPVVAVVHEVDAGIHATVCDLGVAAHAGAPFARVVADHIVREARQHAASLAGR
jgi:hypothetical protein